MTNKAELFKQINNAVLDLQSSDLQSFSRPVKNLARLIGNPLLREINLQLTSETDLDVFLAESERTQGGMVGSATLAWPDDPLKCLGLTILLIERFAGNPDLMVNFGHTYFHGGSKIMAGIHGITRQMIIPFARDYRDYVLAQAAVGPTPRAEFESSNKVFIVHGHDGEAREMVARFLEKIGFEAVILHEQANLGRTVIEKVEAHSDVSFAVVLLTPDDQGCTKGGITEPRARQNVLLELGYFIGKLGRERVCALKRGSLEIPSDFAGVVWDAMDSGGGWKLTLARELRASGHTVDLNRV